MQNTIPQANRNWPEGAMTRDQFVAYAEEYLFGEGVECFYEQISEAQGEISRFGDSGPGTMLHLRNSLDEYNKVANRYEQFTGNKVQRPRLPVYPYFPSEDEYA